MGRPKAFETDVAIGAARDVFWARGYEATSVDDLTRAMRLGRASLYHAFGDKHALFLRALDRYAAERMSDLRRGLASAPSARAAIANVLRGTVEGLWSDGERRGCLLVNSTTELAAVDPAVAMRAGEGFERVAAEFRSVLERGQQAARSSPTWMSERPGVPGPHAERPAFAGQNDRSRGRRRGRRSDPHPVRSGLDGT